METLSSSETSVLTRATHGVTFQKTAFFIVTAVKTSNLTYKCVYGDKSKIRIYKLFLVTRGSGKLAALDTSRRNSTNR
jgi:hypothetical protein